MTGPSAPRLAALVCAALMLSPIGSAFGADPVGSVGGAGDCCAPKPARKLQFEQLAYPLCFYDTDQLAVANAKAFWKTYPARIEEIVKGQSPHARVVVGTSRTAFVHATMYRHRKIARIWPDVACIGSTSGAGATEAGMRCRRFVRDYLDRLLSDAPFSEPSSQPVCQTFLDVPTQ